MTVDIRVQSVKPLRNTFGHIARRFGDKPASRYQEGTYDLQSEVNHHYKPLWDPEHELYDKRRTAVQMQDWYALKDPRQYYYGAWTTARARQQDATDRQMEFAEKHRLLAALPETARQLIVASIVPLRHCEWGANMNLGLVSAYGWGTAVTQAASMAAMDRLGMAQHLSRMGLLVDGNSGQSLNEARRQWLEGADWQPLRRSMERLMARRDWFEVLVAQALVADGLLCPFFFQRLDAWFAQQHGPAMSTLLDPMVRLHEESARWTDAVVKTAVAESAANGELIQGWSRTWRQAFSSALAPLARSAMGVDGASAAADVDAAFSTRLAKLGLAA